MSTKLGVDLYGKAKIQTFTMSKDLDFRLKRLTYMLQLTVIISRIYVACVSLEQINDTQQLY